MKDFTKKEKEFLLDLAQNSLFLFLTKKEILTIPPPNFSKNLLKKRGVFVTLKKQGNLRGCIGSLIGTQPLYKEVIENTIKAGFADPRFPSLVKQELKNLEIEISILTPLKFLKTKNIPELLKYLKQKKPGILLQDGPSQATFLPQVWQELPEPKDFLTHLSLKAGLSPNAWQDKTVKFYQYQVESFKKII